MASRKAVAVTSTYRVHNLAGFVRGFTAIAEEWTTACGDEYQYFISWFRGHRRADWPLLPKLHRDDYANVDEEGSVRKSSFRGGASVLRRISCSGQACERQALSPSSTGSVVTLLITIATASDTLPGDHPMERA
jgi:hypothetical protein